MAAVMAAKAKTTITAQEAQKANELVGLSANKVSSVLSTTHELFELFVPVILCVCAIAGR